MNGGRGETRTHPVSKRRAVVPQQDEEEGGEEGGAAPPLTGAAGGLVADDARHVDGPREGGADVEVRGQRLRGQRRAGVGAVAGLHLGDAGGVADRAQEALGLRDGHALEPAGKRAAAGRGGDGPARIARNEQRPQARNRGVVLTWSSCRPSRWRRGWS